MSKKNELPLGAESKLELYAFVFSMLLLCSLYSYVFYLDRNPPVYEAEFKIWKVTYGSEAGPTILSTYGKGRYVFNGVWEDFQAEHYYRVKYRGSETWISGGSYQMLISYEEIPDEA